MRTLTGEQKDYRYCLEGEILGVEARFDLAIGEYRIGSSSASDIRLPADSVSRQHALLRVTPDGLAVEDRGSKNGTSLNGQRVERASVATGSRIGFGAVELELRRVESEDLDLALTLEGEEADRAGASSAPYSRRETASLVDLAELTVAERWLWLLEGVAGRLFETSQGDLPGALAFLNETLKTAGCCVVEWIDGGDPVVLAALGKAIDNAPDELMKSRQVEDHEPPSGDATSSSSVERFSFSFFSNQSLIEARLLRLDQAPLGLVIWGHFAGREACEVLLRGLLLMIDSLRRRSSHHRWTTATADTSALRQDSPSEPEPLVFPEDYLPGISPAMESLYRQMRGLLKGDLPVLVIGETGVGKERLASILHHSSDRAHGPLVAINCAAIPVDLLEAELFGIDKGVATGVDKRIGKFRQAEGGTLFLDEIGELQPELQAKLLRALQEKQIQPVGGRARTVDVRIVAATNADLDQRMEDGGFRRDLYYRLAGYRLEVPSLRRCREDIPRLVEHFLRLFASQAGVRVRGLTVKALRLLTNYPWPGNVRELQHEIRRLVYQSWDGGVIDAEKLTSRLADQGQAACEIPSVAGMDSLLLAPGLRQLESRFIREALRRAGGRQVRAAELLGISRNGLADKLKRLDIDPRDFVGVVSKRQE